MDNQSSFSTLSKLCALDNHALSILALAVVPQIQPAAGPTNGQTQLQTRPNSNAECKPGSDIKNISFIDEAQSTTSRAEALVPWISDLVKESRQPWFIAEQQVKDQILSLVVSRFSQNNSQASTTQPALNTTTEFVIHDEEQGGNAVVRVVQEDAFSLSVYTEFAESSNFNHLLLEKHGGPLQLCIFQPGCEHDVIVLRPNAPQNNETIPSN